MANVVLEGAVRLVRGWPARFAINIGELERNMQLELHVVRKKKPTRTIATIRALLALALPDFCHEECLSQHINPSAQVLREAPLIGE